MYMEDDMTLKALVQKAQVAHKKTRPEWVLPHDILFRLAKKAKLPVKIDNMTEAYWRANEERLFETQESDVVVITSKKEKVKIELLGPRQFKIL